MLLSATATSPAQAFACCRRTAPPTRFAAPGLPSFRNECAADGRRSHPGPEPYLVTVAPWVLGIRRGTRHRGIKTENTPWLRTENRMRIEHLALNVADPAGMARWYGEHLGMTIARHRRGGVAFFLSTRPATRCWRCTNPPDRCPTTAPGSSFHLAFCSDDVEADYARLLAAGATVERRTAPATATVWRWCATPGASDPVGVPRQPML